jgi:hypothetical protein
MRMYLALALQKRELNGRLKKRSIAMSNVLLPIFEFLRMSLNLSIGAVSIL